MEMQCCIMKNMYLPDNHNASHITAASWSVQKYP